MDTNNYIPTSLPARLGMSIVFIALCITIPISVLAVLFVTNHDIDSGIERSLFIFSSIGFACVSTAGGAFVGHTIVTRDQYRVFLIPAWILMLGSLVFIGSSYLLCIYSGESLIRVLSADWIIAHWPVVVLFIVIMAGPEVGAVASLVCVALFKQRDVDIYRLRDELSEVALQRNRVDKELREVRESMEQRIGEELEVRMEAAIQRFRDRYRDRFKLDIEEQG